MRAGSLAWAIAVFTSTASAPISMAWAASEGAPAVEAYPVDPAGERMDLTMAFVGTRAMFERVGFEVVGRTAAVASRMPRLVMRRDLSASSICG